MKQHEFNRLAELLYSPTLSEPFQLNADIALLAKVRTKEDMKNMKEYIETISAGEFENPIYNLKIA